MYKLENRPYFSKIQQSYLYGIVKRDDENKRAFVQPESTIATKKEVAWKQMVRLMRWVDLSDLAKVE